MCSLHYIVVSCINLFISSWWTCRRGNIFYIDMYMRLYFLCNSVQLFSQLSMCARIQYVLLPMVNVVLHVISWLYELEKVWNFSSFLSYPLLCAISSPPPFSACTECLRRPTFLMNNNNNIRGYGAMMLCIGDTYSCIYISCRQGIKGPKVYSRTDLDCKQ